MTPSNHWLSGLLSPPQVGRWPEGMLQMANAGTISRAGGRAHRDAPPVQSTLPDYVPDNGNSSYGNYGAWGPLRDNRGTARNIDELMRRLELGAARNAPVIGPLDPVPDRPEY